MSAPVTLIAPQDQRRQPWKNGGGTTTEIALVAEGGRPLWRVSVAEVTGDGPFSVFPGMERLLAVVGGRGLSLSVDGAPPVLVDRGGRAFRFSGDAAVACTLIDGPVRAFNLMHDRTKLDGGLRRLAPGQVVDAGAVATSLIYSLDGEALVRANGSAWRLPAGHALRLDGAGTIETRGEAMLATLTRLRQTPSGAAP